MSKVVVLETGISSCDRERIAIIDFEINYCAWNELGFRIPPRYDDEYMGRPMVGKTPPSDVFGKIRSDSVAPFVPTSLSLVSCDHVHFAYRTTTNYW